MASIREWKVRQPLDESDPVKLYGSSNHTYFSICLYHGGRFNGGPDNRGYSPQRMTYIDYVNVNLLCKSTFQEIVESLGYQEICYAKHCPQNVDSELYLLHNQEQILSSDNYSNVRVNLKYVDMRNKKHKSTPKSTPKSYTMNIK